MNEITECLICSGSKFKQVTNKGYYFTGEKVLFCVNCGLFFLSPRMTPEELEVFYKSNSFSKEFRGSEIPTGEMIRYRDERAKRRLSLIKDYIINIQEGPVLEIGCSSGNFLRLLREQGLKTFGIDPSKGFIDYSKKKYGLQVVSGMYPNDLPEKFKGPFAAIAAFQMLEHTTDPRFVLKTAWEQLRENGLLFLEVPDIERVVTQRKFIYHNYFQKSHLWDFSRSTVSMLLKSCGFEICQHYYESPPPYDKNILIIARKQVEHPGMPEINKSLSSVSLEHLFRSLKRKLFFGEAVRYLSLGLKGRNK